MRKRVTDFNPNEVRPITVRSPGSHSTNRPKVLQHYLALLLLLRLLPDYRTELPDRQVPSLSDRLTAQLVITGLDVIEVVSELYVQDDSTLTIETNKS